MSPRSGASAASAAGVTDEIVCCMLLLSTCAVCSGRGHLEALPWSWYELSDEIGQGTRRPSGWHRRPKAARAGPEGAGDERPIPGSSAARREGRRGFPQYGFGGGNWTSREAGAAPCSIGLRESRESSIWSCI